MKPVLRFLPALIAVALLAGCGAMEVKQDVTDTANAMKKGPEAAPERNITNFSTALTCMDNLMIEYGVRDVSTLVEDITDQTKKVNAGTKDMLISAVSDMTKRSRAVRLVAYGNDAGNVVSFLQQAGRKNVYAVLPQYDIKGSISQLDDSLAKKNAGGGLAVGDYFSIGGAKTAAAAVLGLDLTMLNTQDLSVIPGVTSRNSVLVHTEGSGVDTDATIHKFSINYTMALTRSEGRAQALRTLVELAAIELFGKLTKTPYWTCLGATPANPDVQREISDWYYAMFANSQELVAYFQNQLRLRRYYDGPLDGVPNAELRDAVAAYRGALGLSAEPKLNYEFFTAYLSANHQQVLAKSPPPKLAKATAVHAAPAVIEPLKLALKSGSNAKSFKRGEIYSLVVQPNRDAHVYCYLRDEMRKVQRFYPNRFAKDSFVSAATALQIPGSMRFQLVANNKGVPESVACFATERDVLPELPATLKASDFENLPVASLEQVRAAYAAVSGGSLAEAYFRVDVK